MELGQKHQKAFPPPPPSPYISERSRFKTHASHQDIPISVRKNCMNMNTNLKLSESKTLPLLMLVLVMAALVQESKGHPCGSTFFSALVQLIPCRAAVAPFSPIPPTEVCCASIKALGQPCLCVLVNGPPISGVDRSMAMQLPEKCTANFEPCEIAK